MKKIFRRFGTINPKEMQQFNTITSWWHPNSSMGVLFQYNYHRIDFLRASINLINSQGSLLTPLKGLKVLDVGCGAGFLSESLCRLGAQVTALDPNITSYTEAISHKKQCPQLSSLHYQNTSLQTHIQQNTGITYDLVTSMQVIQHVDNPGSFMKQLSQMVSSEGWLMLSTIAQTYSSWFTHIILAEYVTGMVPMHTHTYSKFINRSELQKMMSKNQIQTISYRQLGINWQGQMVEQQQGSNYLILGRKNKQKKGQQIIQK